MKKLSHKQQNTIENWIYKNARSLEVAKWNVLFRKGSNDSLIAEMQKYQNDDGGFGKGFEADILTPESSAISSAEAIFMAQDFGLDLTADWAKKLFCYFEKSRQDIPSFWEPIPKSIEDYPHPPWWSYNEDKEFSPNPCAVIASALVLYGTNSQKILGHEIAVKCFEFIINDDKYFDHDIYCLQRLFLSLKQIKSKLITIETTSAMENLIRSNVCYDESKWMEYVARPFDLVDSPLSPWYSVVKKEGIDKNAEFWINSLKDEGYWEPNFSWGVNTEASQKAIQNWIGYIGVKHVKILKAFGFAE